MRKSIGQTTGSIVATLLLAAALASGCTDEERPARCAAGAEALTFFAAHRSGLEDDEAAVQAIRWTGSRESCDRVVYETFQRLHSRVTRIRKDAETAQLFEDWAEKETAGLELTGARESALETLARIHAVRELATEYEAIYAGTRMPDPDADFHGVHDYDYCSLDPIVRINIRKRIRQLDAAIGAVVHSGERLYERLGCNGPQPPAPERRVSDALSGEHPNDDLVRGGATPSADARQAW